jgi:hypothetical protein
MQILLLVKNSKIADLYTILSEKTVALKVDSGFVAVYNIVV